MRQKYRHEAWVLMELEGGNSSLVPGTILTFTRNTLRKTVSNPITSSNSTKFLIMYLFNTSLECCCYTKLVDRKY
jgi:hypothetical protein